MVFWAEATSVASPLVIFLSMSAWPYVIGKNYVSYQNVINSKE